jgi:hypothetical protein
LFFAEILLSIAGKWEEKVAGADFADGCGDTLRCIRDNNVSRDEQESDRNMCPGLEIAETSMLVRKMQSHIWLHRVERFVVAN